MSTKWNENSSYADLSPYLSALDLWHSLVWNIEFDELEFFLVWTGFLKTTQAVKIQFKQGQNSNSSNFKFQTRECQNSSADFSKSFSVNEVQKEAKWNSQ